jgi:hypothetical protein
MGKLVSRALGVIDGVFDTGGIVRLAVPLDKLSAGGEKDVVKAGKLKEIELPGNETSETELVAKEDPVGRLPLGSNVVLSDRPCTDSESNEDKVGKSSEVPPKSILEKLVVNTLARPLAGIPPDVIELGVVRPGAVKLKEIEGAEKLPVKISEEKEGRPDDELVGSPSECREMLPVENVGSTEPMSDALSDESPGWLDSPDLGIATEVASGMRSAALKVPVVYTVTVYGVYNVTVIEPSQTAHDNQYQESLSTK